MCDDCMGMKIQAKAIQQEAQKQLSQWPQVNFTPEWHPYYWLGQRDAARRLEQEQQPSSDPRTKS